MELVGDEVVLWMFFEEFFDVDVLMDEGGDDGDIDFDIVELDLDVSLFDFIGVNDNDVVIDIDKDVG